MAGIALALDVLCEPGPVVVPTPAYMPFLDVAQLTGRERVDLPLDPDAPHAAVDLDRLDALLAAGARTLLLCQPHNPWGRAFTRAELEGVRDVVLRHGARVVSDEIHAPLVLDGAQHVPYLSLEGTADHAVAVLSASKAFNTPGLKCAQVLAPGRDDARALRSVPLVRNSGMSPLGAVAARAAYDEGEPWLDALRRRLSEQRDLFAALVAEQLPLARLRRQEATYLAWLDARAHGLEDPAGEALRTGRVQVNAGPTFGAGGDGHVRVNLATSPDRLREVVRRLALAWDGSSAPSASSVM
jgi:cystathionine beta-lyase